jgi:hypothetical protein
LERGKIELSTDNLTPEFVGLASAILSFLAVVVASIAAPIVFWIITRKSVADFDGAIRKVTTSADSVDQKVGALSSGLDQLQERLALFDEQVSEQLSSLQESQGRTLGRIEDDAAISESEQLEANAPPPDLMSRDNLIEAWNQIRDLLESFAADPTIDGRRRAKYGRIDRRNYKDLATALEQDKQLPGRLEVWEDAISLWYESRKRLNSGLGDRPFRMQQLRDVLVSTSNAWESDAELSLPEEIRRRACDGVFGAELTADILVQHYPKYSESYIRQILPNFCEGGFKVRDGMAPCFKRIGHGRYQPICVTN